MIQIKSGIIKNLNAYITWVQKYYSCNPSTCICETSKCAKSIVHTSVTESDEIIIANTIEIKKINTTATNVTSTASINWHGKKSKRLLYFRYSFFSDHINIDNFYYYIPSNLFLYTINPNVPYERWISGAIFHGNAIKSMWCSNDRMLCLRSFWI